VRNTEQGLVPAHFFLHRPLAAIGAFRRGLEDSTMPTDTPLPFAQLLGLKIVSVTPERVEATLDVREDLCTRPAVLHGGAVMAFADTLGAIATVANLPPGAGTTTIESKTNFFAAIPVGETAHAECTPLHRGRTTMVWQTKITRADGRLAAVVTQTQLVLAAR
jgi:1,4-dihydroxy-2-naphthoyl-CoA hydrolase